MLANFYTLLSEQIEITLYPDTAPENPTYPCAVYSLISDVDDATAMNGKSLTRQARIQIDVIDTDHANVNAIAATVRNNLTGYRGTVGNSHLLIRFDSEKSSPAVKWGDDFVFIRSMDFFIRYSTVDNEDPDGKSFSLAFAEKFD